MCVWRKKGGISLDQEMTRCGSGGGGGRDITEVLFKARLIHTIKSEHQVSSSSTCTSLSFSTRFILEDSEIFGTEHEELKLAFRC